MAEKEVVWVEEGRRSLRKVEALVSDEVWAQFQRILRRHDVSEAVIIGKLVRDFVMQQNQKREVV